MAKLAKSDVEFESPAKGPHHCGECRHFDPPDACEIVAGAIGADDWCNRFMPMSDLPTTLRKALADTWAFYFQAHSFHWNVQGPLFPQLHVFFGDIYNDAFGAVDGLSERLRTLGEPSPTSLTEIDQAASINSRGIPDANGMIEGLAEDNELVVASLDAAQKAAEAADEDGLANYLQERLDRHAKWRWMLKVSAEDGVNVAPRLKYKRRIA